ncbi:flagellar protein FlaG [Ectopseudomonas toyotomiensis]|uniref:Flagellar protein FlaG n=1 Tax=Ectopseudomonas toyotomiensis TaxID=554344 RepID=A0AA42IKH9_9GAMM|nr:flagellar protein FlaG [Pseudomonas toyotomiensis]MBG0842074.1 flagellar protein FlaG [Pseudomonas toyotomiensis]MDH0701140.1 flagellar protein FlaG [Pseudomonas toyotomiensis]
MDIGSLHDGLNSKVASAKPSQSTVGAKADEPQVKGLLPEAIMSKTSTSRESAVASPERIREAVDNIQEFVQSVRRDLNFSLDDSSGRVVVKVTDSSSGDVIRQIPSEEALKLAESLSEARSLLFSAQV